MCTKKCDEKDTYPGIITITIDFVYRSISSLNFTKATKWQQKMSITMKMPTFSYPHQWRLCLVDDIWWLQRRSYSLIVRRIRNILLVFPRFRKRYDGTREWNICIASIKMWNAIVSLSFEDALLKYIETYSYHWNSLWYSWNLYCI